MRRNGPERAFLFPAASFFLVAAALLCSDAQSQEGGGKNGFCWEVYPAREGDTLVKITKWPRSTHRNIRWDCQAGGCQVEGDVLHLPTGLAGPTHQVSFRPAAVIGFGGQHAQHGQALPCPECSVAQSIALANGGVLGLTRRGTKSARWCRFHPR